MPLFPRLAALAAAVAFALPLLAQASEQKLATVDLQRVVREVKDGQAAKARLEKFLDDQKKLIDQEQEALRQEKLRLDEQAGALSAEAFQERATELQRKVITLARKWEAARAQAAEQEQREMAPILQKINAVIARVAARDGLAMVFDSSQAGLVFAQPKDDITEQVIQAYDKAPGK